MRTNIKSYYDLLNFGLGSSSFQQFVDRFQAKYNTLQLDGFEFDPEIQLNYQYEQLITSLNIATLPVYMDESSQALDKAHGEFVIGKDRIPTQKHRYPINAKMLREHMIMYEKFGDASLSNDTRNGILNILFDSLDKLLGGGRNALTHQRMRTVSKGELTIDVENNPRGLTGLKFEFGIPKENKASLEGNARWWTGTTHTTATEGSESDPLLFLKDKYKEIRRKGTPKGHFEISQDLFDDMLMHSKVLKRIGYSSYPVAAGDAAAESYAQNLTDEAKAEAIKRIIGAPVIVRDSVAAVEKFDSSSKNLVVNTIDNFDTKNVSFIPDGLIGTVKSVKPLVISEDPTQRVAWFDGGRTLVTQQYEAATKSMYVESEMSMLCVPNMPNYMYINTVTA